MSVADGEQRIRFPDIPDDGASSSRHDHASHHRQVAFGKETVEEAGKALRGLPGAVDDRGEADLGAPGGALGTFPVSRQCDGGFRCEALEQFFAIEDARIAIEDRLVAAPAVPGGLVDHLRLHRIPDDIADGAVELRLLSHEVAEESSAIDGADAVVPPVVIERIVPVHVPDEL